MILFPDSISGFPLVGEKGPSVRLSEAVRFLSACPPAPLLLSSLSDERFGGPQAKTKTLPWCEAPPLKKGSLPFKKAYCPSHRCGHAEPCGLIGTGGSWAVNHPGDSGVCVMSLFLTLSLAVVSLKGSRPGQCQRKETGCPSSQAPRGRTSWGKPRAEGWECRPRHGVGQAHGGSLHLTGLK